MTLRKLKLLRKFCNKINDKQIQKIFFVVHIVEMEVLQVEFMHHTVWCHLLAFRRDAASFLIDPCPASLSFVPLFQMHGAQNVLSP